MKTIARTVLADTSYFIALWDKRDRYHEEAVNKRKYFDSYSLVVPWPILYETLSTRAVRRPDWMARFEEAARRFEIIDDGRYRRDALRWTREAALSERPADRPAPSLVDRILLAMIDDDDLRIEGILTFNHRDFAAPCLERRIEYICSHPGAAAAGYSPASAAPAGPRARRRRSRKKT